ncbi:MAG: DotU family type IV/VI secretion system protein [Gemmatimonadales bacterium]
MTFPSPRSARATAGESAGAHRGQLGLALQEVLTATVRLRGNRQVAADAESFRNHVKQLLSTAEQEGRHIGYASDDIALALYAAVTFLDESVLNSSQAMFSDWPSRPLQEEIFGGHMGGEIFFQHVKQLLTRQDSEDLADVLEVFLLCLMLGFRGRYSGADQGEMHALRSQIQEKIGRIRGEYGELAPSWALPSHERQPATRDPWLRWMGVAAILAILAAAGLFVWYRTSLDSGAIAVRSIRAAPSPPSAQ